MFLPSAVADDVGAVACLAASEDGRRAFAGVEDGSVVVVDAATGVVASRVVAFSDKPVLAVDVVTARPPPPDDPFWHARGGRHADEERSAAEPEGAGADEAPTKAPTKAPREAAPVLMRKAPVLMRKVPMKVPMSPPPRRSSTWLRSPRRREDPRRATPSRCVWWLWRAPTPRGYTSPNQPPDV